MDGEVEVICNIYEVASEIKIIKLYLFLHNDLQFKVSVLYLPKTATACFSPAYNVLLRAFRKIMFYMLLFYPMNTLSCLIVILHFIAKFDDTISFELYHKWFLQKELLNLKKTHNFPPQRITSDKKNGCLYSILHSYYNLGTESL